MFKMYRNVAYSILQQLFTFLLPLIIVPYISRTLGPVNIGIYSYVNSIVSYFMLFSLLGISTYGVRMISKNKHDKEKMSVEFWSLYRLQIASTLVMIVFYNIMIEMIIKDYKLYFQSFNILLLSVLFDINWFYQGLEHFKIIVIRNLVIKILSTFLIFVLVKSPRDLLSYIIIMCMSVLCSQVYLFIKLSNYVFILKKLEYRDIFKHVKECLILFIPVLSYSIYRIMSKTMIGYFLGAEELGYYENAEKLLNIPVGIISAVGTVMIPAFSKNKLSNKEFSKQMHQSFKIMFWLIIPMLVGLFVLSKDIVLVLFGNKFLESSSIIQLLSISIIFAAVANIIRTNYLIPFEQNNIYVRSTIYAAVLNFSINFILIPKLGIIGACIGTITAEASVCLYQIYMTRSNIKYIPIIKVFIKFLSASLFMSFLISLVQILTLNMTPELALIVKVIVGIVSYLIITYKDLRHL